MGNYIQILNIYPKINNNLTINKVKKIFKTYNILDNDINIIIGVWDNPDKSNTLGNQGIWIGNDNHIHELIFGLKYSDGVILHFKNNIVLKFLKINSEYLLELTQKTKNLIYKKILNNHILNNLKKINNKSPDLDLIFNIIG